MLCEHCPYMEAGGQQVSRGDSRKSRRFWVKLEACKTDQQMPRSKRALKFSVIVVKKVFETSKGVNLSFESPSTKIIKHHLIAVVNKTE